MQPEARCVLCGMPSVDHVALRYPFRVWWRHTLLRLVSKPLSRIQDTGDGIF